MRASVTVSMAADASGTFSDTLRENLLDVRTALGSTSDSAGNNNTSSKVSPSIANLPVSSGAAAGTVSAASDAAAANSLIIAGEEPSMGVVDWMGAILHVIRPNVRGTVQDVSDDMLPPDPFAEDPNDPAREVAATDDFPTEPLSHEERAELLADLADLGVYQALLEP